MSNVITETKKATKAAVRVEYRGLCATCTLSESCTFPRNVEKPVMHCDEFIGYEMPKTTVAPRTVASNDEERIEIKGLCKNCENYATCTFPKPASGVWRCEEYE